MIGITGEEIRGFFLLFLFLLRQNIQGCTLEHPDLMTPSLQTQTSGTKHVELQKNTWRRVFRNKTYNIKHIL